MQWAIAFYANQSLDGAMDALWAEMQNVTFSKFHPKSSLFKKIRNIKCVCRTDFQPLNIRLKPVCNMV